MAFINTRSNVNKIKIVNNIGKELIHGLEVDGINICKMRLSDGYCDATHMAKLSGKRTWRYLGTSRTKELIKAIEEELNAENREHVITCSLLPIVDVQHGNGTWVHPKLAVDFASWCSPKFGLAVSKLVMKFMFGKLTTEESKETVASLTIDWNDARKVSKESIFERGELMKKIPFISPKHYAQVNNRINQLIFGFECTTKQYKIQKKIPKRKSLAESMSTSQLRVRSLFDSIQTVKLQRGDIRDTLDLRNSTNEGVNDLENICLKIREMDNQIKNSDFEVKVEIE